MRTLEALVKACPSSVKLSVLAPDRDIDGSDLNVASNTWTRESGIDLLYAPIHSLRGLWASCRKLRSTRPSVVYLNSFFNPRMSIFPQVLAKVGFWRGASVLLAPRGEFGQGALETKKLKKKAYLFLYRLFRLKMRVTWHASNEIEASNIRRMWGDRADILVREDETNLPQIPSAPGRTDGQMRAVFLGRLVRHKGLLTVIRALEASDAPMSVDVYGPEEDESYARECKTAAAGCPSNIVFTFHGAIPPESSRDILSQYDVLLMPTRGENFGHVIAEALSVSCPVICSAETQWTEVLTNGGGAVVTSNVPGEWRNAIERFALATPEVRMSYRLHAGMAYARWRDESKGPHVLSMMLESLVRI